MSRTPLIKLVAIDLDGTLLSSRKTITPRTHTAVHAALRKGIHIVLATARPPRSVRPYYQGLKLATPQINYNGALIWDEPQKRIISHYPLSAAQAKKVIAFARREFPEILVSVEILDKWYTDHYAEIPEYSTETAKQFAPDFIGPLNAFLTVPVTKVMLLGPPEHIASLEKSLPAKFRSAIAHTRSDPHLLQILAPGVNKETALAQIAAALKVGRGHIMAIGDAPNDMGMLRFAALAIAPENAWPQVKPLVDHVVPSNDADGVAAALEKFVL